MTTPNNAARPRRTLTPRAGVRARAVAGYVLLALLVSASARPVKGQNHTSREGAGAAESAPGPGEPSANALLVIHQAIEGNARLRASLREERALCEDEDRRTQIETELVSLKSQAAELTHRFETIAAGVDAATFESEEEVAVDLTAEITRLLMPILSELRDATAASREREALVRAIAAEERKRFVAIAAAERAERFAQTATNTLMVARLDAVAASWRRVAEAQDADLSALRIDLEQRLSNRKSWLSSGKFAFANFVRTRGRNLTLSIVAFVAVLLLFRLLGRFLVRWTERKKKSTVFAARLLILLVHLASVLGAIAASLIVLNVAGDWFLLGLALLLLTGAVWALIRALPTVYEQLKLILNLGAVRENEIIIFDGIPWNVKSLGFIAELVSPKLDGGHIELPIRELVGHHSRVQGLKEPLFPTEKGDWVLMDGETLAKIISQTPFIVEILALGGARTAIPTADFLAMHPENLSHNFRVITPFGIDYRHQAECTSSIPLLLQQTIQAGLAEEFGADEILNVQVKFAQAGSSSLDYDLIADCVGSGASQYRDVQRALSRLAVDACNAHGWVIPFTQLTLHQARLSEPLESD